MHLKFFFLCWSEDEQKDALLLSLLEFFFVYLMRHLFSVEKIFLVYFFKEKDVF